MSTDKHWNSLRKRLEDEVDEGYITAGGPSNYYRTQAFREVLEWMAEAPSVSRSGGSDLPERVVHGRGANVEGSYEICRFPKSKEYRICYSNGTQRKITLTEGVGLTQEPVLGQPGGSAFDKAYEAQQAKLSA